MPKNGLIRLERGFFKDAERMYGKFEGPGCGVGLYHLEPRTGYLAIIDVPNSKTYKIDRKKVRALHKKYGIIYETGNLALAVIPVSALEEVKPDTRTEEEKAKARFYGDE